MRHWSSARVVAVSGDRTALHVLTGRAKGGYAGLGQDRAPPRARLHRTARGSRLDR
ncbi:hypothetical protein ACLGIH_01330 [Streptomyces sp. HMX87]|uniref:hypothetical protein n=1 Tax=Streptomyces sp. HMX87 TaxID=3390849 RepID=UPI003A842668